MVAPDIVSAWEWSVSFRSAFEVGDIYTGTSL